MLSRNNLSRRKFIRTAAAGLFVPAAFDILVPSAEAQMRKKKVFISGVSTPLNVTSSTCVLWLDSLTSSQFYQDSSFTTPVASSTDPIGGWKDKSSSAQNWVGTTTTRPLYTTGLLDSKPGAVFDGVDDVLTCTLGTLGAHTVFVVFRSDTGAPTFGTLFTDTTGTSGLFSKTSAGVGYVQDIYSGGDHDSSTTALDSYSLVTLDYNGSGTMNAWKGCVSPVQFMTGTTGIYGSTTKAYSRIGAHNSGPEPLKGAVLQVIAYNTVLSGTDRAAVQSLIHGWYPSLP